MSIESRRHQYGTVFDHWQIGDKLGSGSNGRTAVFHLHHKESAQEESAVKVITLIEEEGRLSDFSDYRRAEYEAELERRKSHALREVQLMYALKGYTNIVSYEDRVTEHWVEDNSFGCDLLIRMELLQDLRKIVRTGHIFSEAEVVQIGKDICSALILCHGEKDPIIHRDIKPENIFVNSRGTYKLGDFGVSRILDKCQGATATTIVGTEAYLAPEQLKKGYDERVDIYSLGLVLYELCNRNRLPFADNTYATEQSIRLRLAGNALPAPCDASPELAKIILKACAFKPNARYKSAQEFQDALNLVATNSSAKRFRKLITHTDGKKNVGGYETVPASNDLSNSRDYSTIPATADESKTAEAVRKFQKLLERAEAGDADAQNGVGCCYYSGDGVEADYEAAVEWFRKAEKQGDSSAAYNLGLCFQYGNGVEKNLTRAEMFYKRAARRGHPSAQYMASKICAEGTLREKHDSIILLYLASQQGHTEAQNEITKLKPEDQILIADFLFYGEHDMYMENPIYIDIDYSAAVEWYTKAATSKNGYAEYVLGYCCENGLGISKDLTKAFSWYEQAAQHHDINGMRCLGECYMKGEAIHVNPGKAIYWFRKAAKAGSIISLRYLGNCYAYGNGVPENLIQAAKYYLKAMTNGDNDSAECFKSIIDKLPEAERKRLTKHAPLDKQEQTESEEDRAMIQQLFADIEEAVFGERLKEPYQKRANDERYIIEKKQSEFSATVEEISETLWWVLGLFTIASGIAMSFLHVPLGISIITVVILSLLSGLLLSIATEFFFDKRWPLVLICTAFSFVILAVITIVIMVIIRAII